MNPETEPVSALANTVKIPAATLAGVARAEVSNALYGTISIDVSGVLHPTQGHTPTPLFVPDGSAFYWTKATSVGWTDDRDNPTPRTAEGWDFENKNQWIYQARRAQLCARIPQAGLYVAYERIYDSSLPEGGLAFANETGRDWSLYWYMNDHLDLYGDNAGTINCDFVVFRL